MKNKFHAVLATAAALALPGVAAAARLSWFDEVPARDSLGQIRAPFPPSNDETLTFGIPAYQSLRSGGNDADYDYRSTSDAAGNVVKIYGEFAPRSGDPRAPIPASSPPSSNEGLLFGSSGSRLSGFGVKWQHRVDATNTVALSAGYSEVPGNASSLNVDAFDTRAAVSWHGSWSGLSMRPGVSGSFFFGDESARDDAYQQLGRRYYGFSVGGELRLAQDHTPYFSYRLRRSFNNPDDPAYLISPYEDRSQILAGWRWQVQPNWSLQAEARYGLNGANLDPYSPDRSRIFFGTRFDFR